jgi:hypothetical protein
MKNNRYNKTLEMYRPQVNEHNARINYKEVLPKEYFNYNHNDLLFKLTKEELEAQEESQNNSQVETITIFFLIAVFLPILLLLAIK